MLSVNGVDLSGLTNQEVVNVLQQAPNNVTLVMSWGTGSLNSKGKSLTNRVVFCERFRTRLILRFTDNITSFNISIREFKNVLISLFQVRSPTGLECSSR